MKEYVEVSETREFAQGLFPDPILRLTVNAVLNQAPRANVVEIGSDDAPTKATARLVQWLRGAACECVDLYTRAMLKQAADRMAALDLANRWIPADDPPEEGIVVLVTDGHCVDTGIYDRHFDGYSVEHAFLDSNDVTGWRSLSALQEVL